jgi:hypothetical protein
VFWEKIIHAQLLNVADDEFSYLNNLSIVNYLMTTVKIERAFIHLRSHIYLYIGILVLNLKYEHAISFINLVKFFNYYQMPR